MLKGKKNLVGVRVLRKLFNVSMVAVMLLMGASTYAAGPDCELGARYYSLSAKAKQEYREEDAYVFLERAAQACPKYGYFQELAESAAQFGDPNRDAAAAEALVQALDLATDDAQRARTTANYAQLLFHNNDPQNALTYVVEARNLDPNSEWIANLSTEITARAANVTTEDIKRGLSDMAFKPLKLNRSVNDQTSQGGGSGADDPERAPSINIPLNFLVNSTQLDEATQNNLEVLAAALLQEEFSGRQFVLVGHADVRGNRSTNLELSIQRAQAIATAIEAMQPDLAGRLEAQGKGEDSPLALGSSLADHAINRRLEVVLR